MSTLTAVPPCSAWLAYRARIKWARIVYTIYAVEATQQAPLPVLRCASYEHDVLRFPDRWRPLWQAAQRDGQTVVVCTGLEYEGAVLPFSAGYIDMLDTRGNFGSRVWLPEVASIWQPVASVYPREPLGCMIFRHPLTGVEIEVVKDYSGSCVYVDGDPLRMADRP